VLFVAYSWLVVTIAPRPLGPILGLLVAGPMVYLLLTWVILGGTPAMRLMGLRIHRAADGGPIGYRTAAIRLLVFVATVLGSVLIVGLVLFLPTVLDDTRRAIHDRVAGTVVTRRALRASRE
jgi:uncharacterized RDD family membrane protein YckC